MFAFHRLGFRLAALTLTTGAVAITGMVQASAQELPAFTCTDKSGGSGSAAGTVSDVRVAHHNGYDRVVIGFPTANAMPQYQLNRQTAAPASAAPSATTGPSTATSQPVTAADLAATGHPANPAQPATFPIVVLILGLLAVTGGLTIAGLRRFARK